MRAVMKNETAVVVAKNCTGSVYIRSLEPSEEDISSTARIAQSGTLLGIKVLDHLIFNGKDYYSFLEHGLL